MFVYNGATASLTNVTFNGSVAPDAGKGGIGSSAAPYTGSALCPGQDSVDVCGITLNAVNVATNVPGLAFTVDGSSISTTPQTFSWASGSQHTVATTTPQAGATGTQYVFTQWSDGTTNTTDIATANASTNSLTAIFQTHYLLTTAVNSTAGGTVSADGYYDANASAPVTATANPDYYFAGWTGPVASASSATTMVSMAAPEAVTANFQMLANVTYLGDDTTTEGAWTIDYGTDGYVIDNLGTVPPSYGTVGLSGDKQYIWAGTSTDPRALETAANSSVGTAATFYSAGSFNIRVNLEDGKAHRVALYLLDWDSGTRVETIAILDAAINTMLSTQKFSSFHNGLYASWSVQGDVVIQVTRDGGDNAVVSGIFFDPLPALATVTYAGVNTTTRGNWTGSYGAEGQVIANSSAATAPSYAKIGFNREELWTWANPTADIRGLQQASGSGSLLNLLLHQQLQHGCESDRRSDAPDLALLGGLGFEVARGNDCRCRCHDGNCSGYENLRELFRRAVRLVGHKWRCCLSSDEERGRQCRGEWRLFRSALAPPDSNRRNGELCWFGHHYAGIVGGHYGSNGSVIANETVNLPAYAAIGFAGDKPYVWTASTSDGRALQTTSGASTRTATTYYSPYSNGSFDIDVNLTDGNPHKISFYLVDWDSTLRAETISVVDPASGTLLDKETYEGFHNGEYAAWTVSGHVVIQVTKTAGANAVVSGVFVD